MQKKHRFTLRISAIFLLLCLCVQLIPFASAKQFTDVTRSQLPEYFDAINYVVDNGIMNGTSGTTFEPNSFVTRAMFITTLYRYAGSPADYASTPFTDVPSSHWAYNAVRWGVKNNIVSGTSGTTFSPDQYVTREQAMTFLWRYLTGYQGETPYYYGSITNCADYSSVSAYARNPMLWAVSNAIIFKSSSYIYPTANVYRKELALWITRYGSKVEGIRFKIDRFSFRNRISDFSVDANGHFRMSEAHYNRLIARATDTELESINKLLDEQDGVCYGMCLSMLLDKLGVIDINGNFSKNAPTVYSMSAPYRDTDKQIYVADRNWPSINFPVSESVIVFYQTSQCIKRHGLTQHNVNMQNANPYANLISDLRTYGFILVGYTIAKGGHAVLLYGMPRLVNGQYEISCYDPNKVVEQTVKIATDGSMLTLPDGESVTALSYFTSFYSLGNLDIDGDYNSVNSSTLLPNSQDLPVANNSLLYDADDADDDAGNNIWINVKLGASCTVTNGDGQTLIIDNGNAHGEIPVYQTYLSGFGTSICYNSYLVPYSDTFTFETSDQSSDFTVDWVTCGRSFSGNGVRRAVLSLDGVYAEGENMTYALFANTEENPHQFYKAVGQNEEYVMLSTQDSHITIRATKPCETALNDVYTRQYFEVSEVQAAEKSTAYSLPACAEYTLTATCAVSTTFSEKYISTLREIHQEVES